MMIGNFGTLCPEKRSVMIAVSVRALISGTIICFINASIAGKFPLQMKILNRSKKISLVSTENVEPHDR